MSGTDTRAAALELRDLSLAYRMGRDWRQVVHGVSLTIAPGEVLGLVGESGSGKSSLSQSAIGLLPANGRITGGRILLSGTDVTDWSGRRFDALRGRAISLIPQDPGASLNPVLTVGAQVGEILRLHGWRGGRRIREKVIDLLDRTGLDRPALRHDQYPHELSGGMRQRVLIAIAVALEPALIIADEPTSALDVTVQKRVLDLIDGLRRESGTALLLVTHDLGIAADRADRIAVLRHGRLQESGPARSVLANPSSSYTRQLLADIPSPDHPFAPPRPAAGGTPAIELRRFSCLYPGSRGRAGFLAVDDVSFAVAAGTTHALVGESGSGKTTVVNHVTGFLRPAPGQVLIEGQDPAPMGPAALRLLRKNIQLVQQNPYTALDPRQSIRAIIAEPLLNYGPLPKDEREGRVRAGIAEVGLPSEVLERTAAALSGGQRQRVAIARALILRPRVLVLDEAVSALDVSVQAQILRLLQRLQQELGLTYLFITHDLAVVRQIADTVTLMRKGRLVESGPVREVFTAPRTGYARELLDAVPGQRLFARPVLPSPSLS